MRTQTLRRETPLEWLAMAAFGFLGVIWVVRRLGQFSGRHAAVVFVHTFGTIITVNLFMAYSAVSTFPGLEVKNGYIASQSFDQRRAAQIALGWSAEAVLDGDRLAVRIKDAEGRPVQAGTVQALVGRSTSNRDDFTPELAFDGTAYVANATLAPGKWIMHLRAVSLDGQPFEQRLQVRRGS